MFRASNPYDEIVTRATDETLTSESWDLNLRICDKIKDSGEPGARQAVTALLPRLQHRSANVQLLSLSLADSLGLNVAPEIIYPELSSRAFCSQLLRMVRDRAQVHEAVRRRILHLIQKWARAMGPSAQQAEGNGAGAIMQETYQELKAEHYDFEEKREPPPKTTREKEEEELQRVLALSLQDQGGRTHYTPANMASRASPSHQNQKSGASAGSGRTVVPAVSESTSVEAGTSKNSAAADPAPTSTRVARVRALYDFTAGEQGELGFQTGDVIRVLNTAYEHWWKGELHGRMGIFPVNYVEPILEPSEQEKAQAAEMEANVFAASSTIDALVNKLAALEAAWQQGQALPSSLTDDEELQSLYQEALAISPQLGGLVNRYQSHLDDLRGLNEHFVQARARYDQIVPNPAVTWTAPPGAGVPGVTSSQPRLQPQAPPLAPLQTHLQDQDPTTPGAGPSPGPAGPEQQQQQQQQQHPQQHPQQQAFDQPRAGSYALASGPSTPSMYAPTSPVPQIPPGLDPSSPEYARWYYSVFSAQAAPSEPATAP